MTMKDLKLTFERKLCVVGLGRWVWTSNCSVFYVSFTLHWFGADRGENGHFCGEWGARQVSSFVLNNVEVFQC